MKKLACLLFMGWWFLFLTEAEAANKPIRLIVGGYAEPAYLYFYQGLGLGGEIGLQISEMISLVAEGMRGKMVRSDSSESDYGRSQSKDEFILTPFCFSLQFSASFSELFQPYVSLGLAYTSLKVTEEYNYQIKASANYSHAEKETWDLHALAPVFKLGLGIFLSRNLLFVGEYKQIVAAKDRLIDKGTYSTSEADFSFGSHGLKIGLRLIF